MIEIWIKTKKSCNFILRICRCIGKQMWYIGLCYYNFSANLCREVKERTYLHHQGLCFRCIHVGKCFIPESCSGTNRYIIHCWKKTKHLTFLSNNITYASLISLICLKCSCLNYMNSYISITTQYLYAQTSGPKMQISM